MKQQRQLQISPALLVELFKAGERHFEITQDAIPDDAILIGFGATTDGLLVLVVESEMFSDETPNPVPAPIFQVGPFPS